MKKLILGLILSAVFASAQAPTLPVLTSITPNATVAGHSVTVTIAGKNFKSGMVLLISGPAGSLPMATKVVNQYKATAVVDGPILQTAGIKRIYLLNKQGQTDLGEKYFQICEPLRIVTNAVDATGQPFVDTGTWVMLRTDKSYQLQVTGGCK